MNKLLEQKIIRFNLVNPIMFNDGNQPWAPELGKDYTFGIEPVEGSNTVILLDEDPAVHGGIARSRPVSKRDFTVVGDRKVVVMSSYRAGFAAQMSRFTKLFLEGEITSFENMTGEEASQFSCDLDWAQSSLQQMDNIILAEVLEIEDEGTIEDVRGDIEREIGRLIEDLGGSSDLRQILVWNA